jgi:hypothetical protein
MPEVLDPPVESLGWRAGLSDDLKQNDAFKDFKTVSDFGKNYLEVKSKATELEGKLKDYVPKLPDNATDEQRNQFYESLGRPKQPSEYEFDGEDKNAPEWTSQWKQNLHSLGLNKTQAKALSAMWNSSMQKMVEAHNASVQNEYKNAEAKLKSEMGDKYDTNVELAKRMTVKHLGSEFDKTFENLNAPARFGIVKLLLKVAELTGEDRSPQGGMSQSGGGPKSFITYDKSSMPPKK